MTPCQVYYSLLVSLEQSWQVACLLSNTIGRAPKQIRTRGGKHVLVTGATGFVGRHLSVSLAQTCGEVTALVRSPKKAEDLLPSEVRVREGDMTEPGGWPDLVEGVDAAVHLANVLQGPPETIHAVNVEGTQHLARRVAEGTADRFLFASSVMVYGFSAPPVVTEETEFGTDVDAYGRSKQKAERLLIKMHEKGRLDPVIVEPCAIYGPHDETWTLRPFKMARDGQAVLPDGGQGMEQPIYISDLTEGITAALRRGQPGERYILSGPSPTSLKTYAGHFTDMVGTGDPRTLPGWVLLGIVSLLEGAAALTGHAPILTRNEVRYLRRKSEYRHEKAAEELGFEPEIRLEEGMVRVERWLREEGHLE